MVFLGCSKDDDSWAACEDLSQAKYELKISPNGAGTIDERVLQVVEGYSTGFSGIFPQIKVEFTAMPKQGYEFKHWLILLEGPETPNDTPFSITENPLTRSVYCHYDNYRKFLTLTAVFEEIVE